MCVGEGVVHALCPAAVWTALEDVGEFADVAIFVGRPAGGAEAWWRRGCEVLWLGDGEAVRGWSLGAGGFTVVFCVRGVVRGLVHGFGSGLMLRLRVG